jgi:hypothetical protein
MGKQFLKSYLIDLDCFNTWQGSGQTEQPQEK